MAMTELTDESEPALFPVVWESDETLKGSLTLGNEEIDLEIDIPNEIINKQVFLSIRELLDLPPSSFLSIDHKTGRVTIRVGANTELPDDLNNGYFKPVFMDELFEYLCEKDNDRECALKVIKLMERILVKAKADALKMKD